MLGIPFENIEFSITIGNHFWLDNGHREKGNEEAGIINVNRVLICTQ